MSARQKRNLLYRARETLALTWIWARHTTFSQRAAGVLALLIVFALFRAELRLARQGHAITRAEQIADRVTVDAGVTATQVKQILGSQTGNRVKNVAIWCEHFVRLEHAIVAYVNSVPAAPPLPLRPLTHHDCTRLEHGTARSGASP